MGIDRSATIPPYYDYITSKALIPMFNEPDAQLKSYNIPSFEWIEIPYYQRGIAWKLESVQDFLSSDSILLGNIILSRFPVPSSSTPDKFKYIPRHHKRAEQYAVLVDGLQRLAVGTMLLNILHPLVIDVHPIRSDFAELFQPLSNRVRDLAVVYTHNHKAFLTHKRTAVSNQYRHLAINIEKWILKCFSSKSDAQELADMVIETFMHKQIAIDIYTNFTDTVELMYTFLGLNTVRVDLGIVDLLRARLVEQASLWNSEDIEVMENEFTEIFTDNKEKIKPEFRPLVGIILEIIRQDKGHFVFPSWKKGLEKSEVDGFMEFVREFLNVKENCYLEEIRRCGSIPFAIVLLYYYVQYLEQGQKPSFFTGGPLENAELHKFLLANYRVLLDGNIGRTREYGERVIMRDLSSLSAVADSMSIQFTNRSVQEEVDKIWLKAVLNKADKEDAKRVFNAMMLPSKSNTWGANFQCHAYGLKSDQYYIEYLIPPSRDNDIGKYAVLDSLRNYIPIQRSLKSKTSRLSCYEKLNTRIGQEDNNPYCQWLVEEHLHRYKELDFDKFSGLEVNQTPGIGDERIEFIVEYLIPRL